MIVIFIWILWRKFDSRPFPPLLFPSELFPENRKTRKRYHKHRGTREYRVLSVRPPPFACLSPVCNPSSTWLDSSIPASGLSRARPPGNYCHVDTWIDPNRVSNNIINHHATLMYVLRFSIVCNPILQPAWDDRR